MSTIEKEFEFEKKFDQETKGWSKKEKTTFRKIINHQIKSTPIRDRLRKKIRDRERSDW